MTRNLLDLLLQRSKERPGLKVGTVDAQVTLADALGLAVGGANQIQQDGLDQNDRIAVVASTSTEYILVWMACLLAGIPVALINPTYPRPLLGQMLDNLDPKLVFTDLGTTSFAGQRLVRPMASVGSWQHANATQPAGLNSDKFAVASYMHTSGTTGVPKFCAQTHEYFLRLGTTMSTALGLNSSDRMLAPLPFFHINPMGYGFIGAITAGADALTVAKFSASGFWPTVREHGITALALHSPPVEILKRATTGVDAAGHQVRTMFYADGEFMSRFGIEHAVSGYGSTEAAGVSHLHQWRLGDDIPINASRYGGLARADIEDKIDENGEIYVRERAPGTLFAGYFADGRLKPSRDENGWFATGDLGCRDDQAGLVFLERAAESIRVKGEFVPIPYVEAQFGTIPEFRDLALWKKPGALVDDDLVLYIVADKVPVKAVRRIAAGLPAFMRPVLIARVVAIPRDAAAGKVQRRLLDHQEVLSWQPLK